MNQETYRHLVSGRTRGPRAAVLRALLTVFSQPYGVAVRIRNGLYSTHLLKIHRAGAAVISVGNLTVGGTGKTPLVVWLVKHLQSKGLRVAVLTRGYKATHQKSKIVDHKHSDEPALLAAMCPGVRVIVDPDRVAGARRAIRECEAEVLVLDDGFQHRRLGRDVDIVTIDATSPFGHDRLLPAGLLREPVAGLQRADAVVITRCDHVSEKRLAWIKGRIRHVNSQAALATAVHAPVRSVVQTDEEIALEKLRDKKVYAFCGLGNPEAFFDTLRRIGCVLAEQRTFDDHHEYTPDCLREIRRQGVEKGVDYLLTTQKDWTKVAPLISEQDGPPLAYLAVELAFTGGADPLIALIDCVLGGTMPPRSKT